MSNEYRRSNQLYIVGNNATRLDTYTDSETTREEQIIKKARPRQVRRQYRYKMKLACLLAVTMMMCIVMVKTQLTVSARSDEIVELQKELNSLKKNNSLIVENISNNIKLETVYEVATTKLGMVMPSQNQISNIKVKKGSYTQQLADIEAPKEQQDISNILGFILSN